jgi:hypothetical protein
MAPACSPRALQRLAASRIRPEGGVWVSVGWDPSTGEVVQIDPQTNEVVTPIDTRGPRNRQPLDRSLAVLGGKQSAAVRVDLR